MFGHFHAMTGVTQAFPVSSCRTTQDVYHGFWQVYRRFLGVLGVCIYLVITSSPQTKKRTPNSIGLAMFSGGPCDSPFSDHLHSNISFLTCLADRQGVLTMLLVLVWGLGALGCRVQ